jgi:hypothetical protein
MDIRDARLDDPAVIALLGEWDAELGFAPKGGVAADAADFSPPRGAFVVAVEGGDAVGCGGVRPLGAGVGELKRLIESGWEELRLDTAGDSAAALALFRSAGYEEISDYNGNPHARFWFAKRPSSARR